MEAVEANVSFETYCKINPRIIISNEGTIDDSKSTVTMQHVIPPGTRAMSIVMTNMLKFPQKDNIQLICLDIILKSLELQDQESDRKNIDHHNLDLFSNQTFMNSLLQALHTKAFEIRWRAHLLLLKLTHSYKICNCVERSGGCLIILDILKVIDVDEALLVSHDERSVYQLALYTLANLCSKSGK